jgi:hypothetical protein
MLRHGALVRTDVSEERITSIFRGTGLAEVGGTSAVIGNRNSTVIVVPRFADYCHPEDESDTFLRNVGSYISHTA